MKKLVITIDGPSGSGKGTTAEGISKLLSIPHVDSGAIYRTVAFYLNALGITEDDDAKIEDALTRFVFAYNEHNEVLLDGVLVEDEIRSRENSIRVFGYSRNPIIRTFSTDLQRSFLQENGGVLDGRDAGSIVAPFADVKIFLDCSISERVRRRAKQHNITNPEGLEELYNEIVSRDTSDANNQGSFKMMPDTVVVDTTGLTVDEQIQKVYELALSKLDS